MNGSSTDLGFIAVWNVSSNGALSPSHDRTNGGGQIFSMTPVPGTDAFLTSDPTRGFEVWDFMGGTTANVINGHISGQNDSCWSIFSHRSGTYFITDRLKATVFEVALNKELQGSVVGKYLFPDFSELLDIGIAKISGNEYVQLSSLDQLF